MTVTIFSSRKTWNDTPKIRELYFCTNISVAPKMGDEGKEKENPWSYLSTIATFDHGNESWTTRCVGESQNVNGGRVVGRVAPSTSLLIESLIKQVCTMFEDDPVRRNKLYYTLCDKLYAMNLIDSSYNMDEFEAMRGQYQTALYQLVMVARAAAGCENIIKLPTLTNFMDEWSRYRKEFIEIDFIAAGGFGSVYKALHRLDGHEYAIKKIIVRSGRVETILKHLEEVKTLAKLNHTNIVAYKGAWIEQSIPPKFVSYRYTEKNSTKSTTKSVITSVTNSEFSLRSGSERQSDNNVEFGGSLNSQCERKNNGMYFTITSSERISHCDKTGDIVIDRFQQLNSKTNIIGRRIDGQNGSSAFEEDISDVVSFRNDSAPENLENVDGTQSSETNSSDTTNIENKRIVQYEPSKTKKNYATLYIQMALCEQTLREWMDKREEPTPKPILSMILTQTLEGLNYIHSLRTVHHDIKPSNIFIGTSGQLRIQLGDFGLACPLQQESHPGMGTKVYAAPEQLKGVCDPKSDVYSLGIVFFELLFHMSTGMERSYLIMQLKVGNIPENYIQQYPEWCELIKKLVQEDPKKRPSTEELLNKLSRDKDSIIANLTDRNREKDDKIQGLADENEELKRKNEELTSAVTKLKIELERLKIQNDI